MRIPHHELQSKSIAKMSNHVRQIQMKDMPNWEIKTPPAPTTKSTYYQENELEIEAKSEISV